MYLLKVCQFEMSITFFTIYILLKFCDAERENPLSDEFIDKINSLQSSWRAGRNFHQDSSIEFIRALSGTFLDRKRFDYLKVKHLEVDDNLPEHFDARKKCKNCPSVSEVRDQGACGSCWAFAATEVMTDRVCIHSNGTKNVHFSAIDLIWCCDAGNCNGGSNEDAFRYWIKSGIVSGGNYDSKEKGCKPYPFVKCNHHVTPPNILPECDTAYFDKPCNKTCVSKDIDYEKDKHFGKSAYRVKNEQQIMQEIITNGPVTSSFVVYNDFLSYVSGVYRHVTGSAIAQHVVKIIGWGVENGTKYWLIANSWNELWGEKGFFKMLRGEDECYIDSSVYTGMPAL